MTRNGYNLNDNKILNNNNNNNSSKINYPEQLNVDKLKSKNHDVESGKKYKNKFKLSKFMFWKNKANTTADSNKKDVKITEHLMEIPEVCSKLGTNAVNGLDEKEAAHRLARDGPNAFTPPKQTPWWILYLEEMVGGFALLLWAATIGTFIAYGMGSGITNLYVAIILIIVIVASGTFSYYQQARSSSVFKSFKKMAPQQTTVIRDGKRRQISAAEIVVGDLIYCKSGETVPADIRVIKCESMKVDNSSLTGESDPLTRSPDIGHENPLEARNVAFFSTYCVDGNGYGIAIATGDQTVMGEIARLVTNIKNEKTPLAIEISRFVKIITIIALTEGVIFFAICMGAFKQNFFNAFLFFIGIVIGNVPEGLLPALSVALTVTAKRMASKNCMVKNLQAVETLGSTSVICSDKTGTLTQNRMTVEHCWMGSDIFKVSHNREEVKQQMNSVSKCWDAYKRCAILCSRSEFTNNDPDIMKRECNGDASETAILRFMESVEGPVIQYRSKFPKVAERPFSSTTKYQFSIHHNTEVNSNSVNGSMSNFFLVMKGAPERIIKMCKYYVKDDGTTAEIDDNFNEGFEDSYRELGSMGERVLALCDHDFTQLPANYKFNLEEGNDFQLSNFRFLGLVAMIDPPRPTVPGAVEKCRKAGIKVVMVTGDHPITAQAIAKQVGIISNSHRKSTSIRVLTIDKIEKNTRSVVVPGDELSDMSDSDLKEIIGGFGEIVFARTSPQQKLRIVTNFQELGQIVAVTGDGVNDSPALKKADIGIAMGITGSEVSKQAADMILMDDNFATIVIGVEEGRRIFDNMKKAILYIGSVNVTTIYPYIAYLIFGFPLPIGTITVLLICLGINIAPAVALAYERAESDIMYLPPRNPKKDKLVTIELLCRIYLLLGMIGTVMGFNGYFVYFFFEGLTPDMLWQLRTQWEDPNALVLKYGPNDTHWGKPTQLIDYNTRNDMILQAESAYFVAIAIMSAIAVICCKTRRLSIFSQGMRNWTLNYCIVITTALSALVVYCPGLNMVLQQSNVMGQVWVTTIPFVVYIFFVEEISKLIVRKYPDSFLGKELLF